MIRCCDDMNHRRCGNSNRWFVRTSMSNGVGFRANTKSFAALDNLAGNHYDIAMLQDGFLSNYWHFSIIILPQRLSAEHMV